MSSRADRGPELAGSLHRLRSTLARIKAEVELAHDDGVAPPVDALLSDLREALSTLESIESAAYSIIPVLVIDDDERLGELTARGLRRLGYEAEFQGSPRPLRAREVVVLDLGASASFTSEQRELVKAARPIVVTGAADPASRALAEGLDASAYVLKPVELAELAAAIKARASER